MHASVKLHAMTGGNSADGPSVAIGELPIKGGTVQSATPGNRYQVAATSFVVLFWIVSVLLWGLHLFYDFMVPQFGWTHAQLTSGNALSKLGILMAASALLGLGWV